MWPSIVFQPAQLAKSMIGAKVWRRATPLSDDERVDYSDAVEPVAEPVEEKPIELFPLLRYSKPTL